MKNEVQTSPGLLDTGEDRFELAWLANVTGDDDGAFETFGKRPGVSFGLRVQMGDGKALSRAGKGLGAAVSDTLAVGYANDQPLIVLERHGNLPAWLPNRRQGDKMRSVTVPHTIKTKTSGPQVLRTYVPGASPKGT
jgi:hypothetical protein